LNNNISDKDKKDWEVFISSKEKLINKESKYPKKIPLKIRSIDLHGYTLEEANKTIEDFINKSYVENVNKLIVVTGKGLHMYPKI
jgi:DNA-nicking Smr family endonuclease